MEKNGYCVKREESNTNMKKFQNGRRWGNPGRTFMYHAWGRSTERIDRWEKQNESCLLWAAVQTVAAFTLHFTAESAARHSHSTFSQMCLSFLITVASVFGGWSHWVYLYDQEAVIAPHKWCVSVFPYPVPSDCIWMPLVAFVCSPAIVDWDLQWKPFDL